MLEPVPLLQDHPWPGTFVVIEGADGTGKTTLVSHLANERFGLMQHPQTVRFPGNTVREHALFRALAYAGKVEQASPLAVQLLHMADRIQVLAQVVTPALSAGRTVLSDRYVIASMQSCQRFKIRETSWLLEGIKQTHLNADIGFYLTVEPYVAMSRIRARSHDPDRHITVKEYGQRQDEGAALARELGWSVLPTTGMNATDVADTVAAFIIEELRVRGSREDVG